MPNIMQYNLSELKSAPEISLAFVKIFQANSSNTNYENFFISYKNEFECNFKINLIVQSDEPEYNLPFNSNELLSALNNCCSKSPVPDNIPYIFLKNFSIKSLNICLRIYNLIWGGGIFLNQWKQALVVPILKPGKDKFNITSYCLISLISTLCKLLEKMVNKRLVWHLEASNKFTKQQYGFRQNHSTNDVLATLHTDITDAIMKKQHLILLALNIEKSYDMV